MLSNVRAGKFTSSQIYKLMLKGRGDKPSSRTLEYIEEIKIERRLHRPLNSAASSRPMEWGHALESHVADMLDTFEYNYVSDQTIVHPTIPDWCGTPDLVGSDKVGDIKCPYTLKSFAHLADICHNKDLERFKTEVPEYFWQLVSNAILTGKNKAELIVYCPYQSDLDVIRERIENLDDTDLQTAYQWIQFNPDEKLPYIPDKCDYANFYRFVFEVAQQDKDALTAAVQKAVTQLD